MPRYDDARKSPGDIEETGDAIGAAWKPGERARILPRLSAISTTALMPGGRGDFGTMTRLREAYAAEARRVEAGHWSASALRLQGLREALAAERATLAARGSGRRDGAPVAEGAPSTRSAADLPVRGATNGGKTVGLSGRRGGAADRDPSSWRDPNGPGHSSERPSDSRPAGPTSHDILPGSCCTECADGASAT